MPPFQYFTETSSKRPPSCGTTAGSQSDWSNSNCPATCSRTEDWQGGDLVDFWRQRLYPGPLRWPQIHLCHHVWNQSHSQKTKEPPSVDIMACMFHCTWPPPPHPKLPKLHFDNQQTVGIGLSHSTGPLCVQGHHLLVLANLQWKYSDMTDPAGGVRLLSELADSAIPT